MTPNLIIIPTKVKLKSYGRMYGVLEAIDTRTGSSLGELSCYGFDQGPELRTKVMMGVIEAILEKEPVKGDCQYIVELEIEADGKSVQPISQEFFGNKPPKYPLNWRVPHKGKICNYLPGEDKYGKTSELPDDYAKRMKADALPNFPEEVLIEWFYRHPIVIGTYSFLPFETLQFDLQVWQLNDIPGCEAVNPPSVCERLVSQFDGPLYKDSWVHLDMKRNGTWNTPILLIDNSAHGLRYPDGENFRSPYHLLEGHHRLSCLIALRRLNKANATHKVWVVRVPV